MRAYWLFKSEPSAWSWQDMTACGSKGTCWDGVRNFLANKNMKNMKKGDRGFFYHSVKEKRIIGMVEVIKEHYPDPSDEKKRFGMVDIKAIGELKTPIGLEDIKSEKALQNMVLVNNSRLSVQPVSKKEWEHISKMGAK